nr:hypothetical protein CFP56_36262 [Quercus suber]
MPSDTTTTPKEHHRSMSYECMRSTAHDLSCEYLKSLATRTKAGTIVDNLFTTLPMSCYRTLRRAQHANWQQLVDTISLSWQRARKDTEFSSVEQ